MNRFVSLSLFVSLPFLVFGIDAMAQTMQKAEEPEEVGLIRIGENPQIAPEGVGEIALRNGNLEEGDVFSEAFRLSRFSVVENDDAPEGKKYAVVEKVAATLSVDVPAKGATPYVLSMWLLSEDTFEGRASCESEEVYYGKHTPLSVPSTGGKWKHVDFYFRTAPGTTAVSISFRVAKAEPALAIDDVRLRPATEVEFTGAWKQWRSQYPDRDLTPEPGFGKNLANFRRKLTNPIVPDKPLLVMGIGSSYTNMLGNGERLVQWIREKYPDAPPVQYKKHVGSAVNYDYTRGWMRQYVLGQRPDLVILYSGGTAEDLEKLLADFRAHSSADVIVASLHLREQDKEITEKTINDPVWDEIRAVAEKYGCEWVDSRREWAAYLIDQGKPIGWLLKDAVHQSDHGALVINENIMRHIVEQEPVDPKALPERLVSYGDGSDAVTTRGNVQVVSGEGAPVSKALWLPNDEDSFVELMAKAIRVDVVGRRTKMPDKAAFTMDRKPLGECSAFYTTLIQPGAKNNRPARGSTSDRSPHMVRLGDPEKIVPQQWVIRMTSDKGDYELVGFETGPDGKGNNGEDFTSNSGQIIVPKDLWRRRLETDGSYSNKKGDTFTWEVKPAVLSEVVFPKGDGELFSVTIADQLPYEEHVIRAKCVKGEGVEIIGFVVHKPAVEKK